MYPVLARASAPDAPRLDGLRALVVDDDDDARELVREILEGVGAEVIAAPGASLALEAKGPFAARSPRAFRST